MDDGPWTMEGGREKTMDDGPCLPADAKASAMAGGDDGGREKTMDDGRFLPADAQASAMAGGDHGGDTSGLRDTWLQRLGD